MHSVERARPDPAAAPTPRRPPDAGAQAELDLTTPRDGDARRSRERRRRKAKKPRRRHADVAPARAARPAHEGAARAAPGVHSLRDLRQRAVHDSSRSRWSPSCPRAPRSSRPAWSSPFMTPFKLAFYVALFARDAGACSTRSGRSSRPGLYRREKRFAVPLLVSSVLLFYVGVVVRVLRRVPGDVRVTSSAPRPTGVKCMPDMTQLPRLRAHDVLRVRRRVRSAGRRGAAGAHRPREGGEAAARTAATCSSASSWSRPSSRRPTRSPNASWPSRCTCSTRAAWSWHASCRRCAAKRRTRPRRKKPRRAERGDRWLKQSRIVRPNAALLAPVRLGQTRRHRGATAPIKIRGIKDDGSHTTTVVSPDYSRQLLRSSARARHAVHDRVLRALHLLRHARDAGAVPRRRPPSAANPGFGIDGATAGAVYGLFTGAAYLLASPAAGSPTGSSASATRVSSAASSSRPATSSCAIPATPDGLLLRRLAVMVLGIGLLKPNVSTMVGALYEGQPGARRDAGFSIFYMGINLGAFLGPLVAGRPRREVELALRASRSAASRCCIGLLSVPARRSATSATPGCAPTGVPPTQRKRTWTLLIAHRRRGRRPRAVVLFVRRASRRRRRTLAHGAVRRAGRARRGLLRLRAVVRRARRRREEARRRHHHAVLLVRGAVLGRLRAAGAPRSTLFAVDYTDRSLLGGMFADGVHPAAWYQSVNPSVIILLAPVFAWLWVVARRAQHRSLGADQDGPGPAAARLRLPRHDVGRASWSVSSGGKVGPIWLCWPTCSTPSASCACRRSGLSNVTKLAPREFVSRMMGTWFLGTAIGNTVAGLVGGHVRGREGRRPAALSSSVMTLIGGGAGVFILLVRAPVRSWIGDANEPHQLLARRARAASLAAPALLASLQRPEGPTPPPKIEAPMSSSRSSTRTWSSSTAKATPPAGRRPPTSPPTRSS